MNFCLFQIIYQGIWNINNVYRDINHQTLKRETKNRVCYSLWPLLWFVLIPHMYVEISQFLKKWLLAMVLISSCKKIYWSEYKHLKICVFWKLMSAFMMGLISRNKTPKNQNREQMILKPSWLFTNQIYVIDLYNNMFQPWVVHDPICFFVSLSFAVTR